MGEKIEKVEEVKEKIPTRSIVHFVIISLLLFSLESVMSVTHLINSGCILGEECVGYVVSTKLMVFSLFSTGIIIYLIFKIKLFKFNGWNFKYLIFMAILLVGSDLIRYGLDHLFYYLLA